VPQNLYFRAPSVETVQQELTDSEYAQPGPSAADGIELNGIDYAVDLAKLVALATGRPYDGSEIGSRLIWPDDPNSPDGPWVVVLDDQGRDALAGIPSDRLPELAERWAGIEEFHGLVKPADLEEIAGGLIALAGRARSAGEHLFCHMSL
jgi:hypothetical protein